MATCTPKRGGGVLFLLDFLLEALVSSVCTTSATMRAEAWPHDPQHTQTQTRNAEQHDQHCGESRSARLPLTAPAFSKSSTSYMSKST